MRLQPSARIEPPAPAPICAAASRELRKPRSTPSPTTGSRPARPPSAALPADARVLARVAADLRDVVADGVSVDPAAAFDQLLLDGGPLRGDEHLALALGAHHGERDLHVLLLHALLGPQAEIDFLRER